MKFQFKINKYYLIGHTIASKNKPFLQWAQLENKIFKKYNENASYYLLNPSRGITWAMAIIQSKLSEENIIPLFKKIGKELKDIYGDILKTKEFKKLYRETENYLTFVEKQWSENKRIALGELKEITGIQIPDKKFNVFITHPKNYNGRLLDQDNIAWGHNEDWKNYTTVYLCHELMHSMTKFHNNYIKPEILHAIIELATDEELRIRLNKKGVYFKEGNKKVGHKELIKIKKAILPYWKIFLKQKNKNIEEFAKKMSSSNISI